MQHAFRLCFLLFAFYFKDTYATEELRFKHLTFKEGLVQSPVTAMLQDHRGFIWIGNWQGLIRYDGYEFKEFGYQAGVKAGISNGRVNVIFEDKAGFLWIGTANGLNRYNAKTETFDYYGSKQLKGGKNYISGITQDQAGTIWVATFAGVFSVDTLRHRLEENALLSGTIYTLFVDEEASLWVGTKTGVRRFDPRSRQEIMLPEVLKNNPRLNRSKILFIRQDQYAGYCFGTEEDGLIQFQPQSGEIRTFTEQTSDLASNMIKDMVFDAEHRLWIGTRGGISVYDAQEQTFAAYRHQADDPFSIYDNSVWSLMIDRDHHVWVGAFSGAISYATPGNNNFRNIGGDGTKGLEFQNRITHAMVPDGDQGLWVATFGGGLHHLDRKPQWIKHYTIPSQNRMLASQHIKSMALDGQNRLWLGTLNGLFAFDTRTQAFVSYPLSFPEGKLSAHLINCLLAQPKGIWAGANGGGLFFIPNEGSARHYRHENDQDNSLSDDFVNCLLADGDKGMWVGTQNGLDYFDYREDKVTRKFRKNEHSGLNSNDIQTLFYDRQQRLWVGTEGGGLYYFDTKCAAFFSLDAGVGLTNNAIHTLLEDAKGNLWASTDDGLFMINFRHFKPPFQASDVQVSHYTSQHGLSGNMYMTNAGYASEDGMLFFGGMNGLTYFSPESLFQNRKAPSLVLTDFMIRNQSVPIDPDDEASPLPQSISEIEQVVLQHNQNYIGIKYAGINYVNPENNRYAYRLDGLADETWHEVGKERIANYTNLDPGEYVFRVKAANSDGVWSEEAVLLHIKIRSPLWKTGWAYTLYTFVALTSVFFILRFVRSRELLKRDLLHEHQKLEFFTYISHEIRTPLTLLLAPLDRMLKQYGEDSQIGKYLGLMDRNGSRLKKLINELLDFRKIEHGKMKLYFSEVNLQKLMYEAYLPFVGLAEQKRVAYSFIRDDCPEIAYADKDQLEKVLANLLGNAFKFVPKGGEVQVKMASVFHQGKPMVSICVRDNGPGVPEAERLHLFQLFLQSSQEQPLNRGTGIGLALSKKIVELHGGAIHYTRAGGMTSFEFFLPEAARVSKVEVGPVVDQAIEAGRALVQQNNHLLLDEKNFDELVVDEQPRVLVVDDHPDMRTLLADALKEQYSVLLAKNGAEAYDMAIERMPDLIISDVMMPEVNGLDFCERVKMDERINHIPVVLLTAKTADIHQLEGLSVGADLYLTKPFSLDMLLLQVRNLLETREAARLKYRQQLVLQPLDIVANTKEEEFLKKLLLLIEDHIEEASFGVPELATAIGMSKSVLYNKVQAITHLSIGNFIKSIRLHKAAAYLREGKYTIAEVAFAVGFNDRKYFSKEFRKQFQCAPSAYLENHSKQLS